MPTVKKKTNYVSYELKKLEEYLSQLQNYLDNNAPDTADDRIERIELPRGGSTIKVISTREQQVKQFTDILREIPKLILDINSLRKSVDDDKKEVDVRGDQDIPGFMDDEEDERTPEKQVTENKKQKKLSLPTSKQEDYSHLYKETDDDFEE